MEGEPGLVHGISQEEDRGLGLSQDEARGENLQMPLRFEPGLSES